jgi:hypothetical protein
MIELLYLTLCERLALLANADGAALLKKVAWWHGEPTDTDTHPFNRPACFIEFGEFTVLQATGEAQQMLGQFSLRVATDSKADEQQGSGSQAEALQHLAVVNAVWGAVEGLAATRADNEAYFTSVTRTAIRVDHEQTALAVTELEFRVNGGESAIKPSSTILVAFTPNMDTQLETEGVQTR